MSGEKKVAACAAAGAGTAEVTAPAGSAGPASRNAAGGTAGAETPVLAAEGLSFSYPGSGRTVFCDVSFSVRPGEVLCVLGPNGAGKSTLLNTLVRVNVPSKGRVLLNGRDIKGLSRAQIAQVIGYVAQSHAVTFGYRVLDYVVMGRAPHIGLCRTPGRDDLEQAMAGLAEMGVERLAERNYLELSGGERQQVDIARAIVQHPQLIILDEPTSALDFGNQAKVIRIVRKLSGEGFAVIMTTHNPNHAVMLDSQVAVLGRDGRLTVGDVASTITEQGLTDVYGADVRIGYMASVGREVCTVA